MYFETVFISIIPDQNDQLSIFFHRLKKTQEFFSCMGIKRYNVLPTQYWEDTCLRTFYIKKLLLWIANIFHWADVFIKYFTKTIILCFVCILLLTASLLNTNSFFQTPTYLICILYMWFNHEKSASSFWGAASWCHLCKGEKVANV